MWVTPSLWPWWQCLQTVIKAHGPSHFQCLILPYFSTPCSPHTPIHAKQHSKYEDGGLFKSMSGCMSCRWQPYNFLDVDTALASVIIQPITRSLNTAWSWVASNTVQPVSSESITKAVLPCSYVLVWQYCCDRVDDTEYNYNKNIRLTNVMTWTQLLRTKPVHRSRTFSNRDMQKFQQKVYTYCH